MREPRHELLREIRRVDAEIAVLWRLRQPHMMARIDAWLDQRLRLMARLEQLETLGFVVNDRRRFRR